MRKWKEMRIDEIYSIWNSYLKTDFSSYDPLNHDNSPLKIQVRITPIEMVKLIEELFERLVEKEKLDKWKAQ